MAVPLLGPMTFSGFGHAWYFLFLLVVLGLIGLYIIVQLARKKRLLRFANMELLESVAPHGRPGGGICRQCCWCRPFYCSPSRWPAHARRSDPPQPRRGDAGDRRLTVHARTDVPPNRLAAAQDAAKQFADELTPGINLGLIAYAGTATVLVSPTTNREATKRRSTSCSWPTARPPAKASSPHCRPSPPSAR